MPTNTRCARKARFMVREEYGKFPNALNTILKQADMYSYLAKLMPSEPEVFETMAYVFDGPILYRTPHWLSVKPLGCSVTPEGFITSHHTLRLMANEDHNSHLPREGLLEVYDPECDCVVAAYKVMQKGDPNLAPEHPEPKKTCEEQLATLQSDYDALVELVFGSGQ